MEYQRVEDALSDFTGYAKIHGIATGEIGNAKIANVAHDMIFKAYYYLKRQQALEQMEVLLDHENTLVRSWAARFLLKTFETKSLDVLKKISNGKKHSFSAKMVLEEFHKGNLTF